MPATSVEIVDELPRKKSVGSGRNVTFRHRFDFSRMFVDSNKPVSRWDDALGYEPMERFVFYEQEDGSSRPTLNGSDLVFLADGMIPRCEVSPLLDEKPGPDRDFKSGRDHPIEHSDAWAIYCQQTGRMG